jgi:hypothetical protein
MVALLTTASLEGQHLAKSFFNTGLLGASGTDAAPSDDQFNRVSFLSHFEGSNNGVNNAFDDGSTSNHTITANGNVTQGSFGPFARPDGEWSWSFDGDGDSLTYTNDATMSLDGDYTFELFFNARTIVIDNQHPNTFLIGSTQLYIHSSDKYVSWYAGADIVKSADNSILTNTWNHVAVVRSGTGSNNTSLYLNGTRVAQATNTATQGASSGTARIGSYTASGGNFNGHISNLRLLKGTALYSGSSITVPTSALTAITNTKLLTCQSNRFIDNSSTGFALTPVGNPAVTAFGPFLSNSVYDPAVNGASAYFDGDNDFLSTGDSADFVLGDTFTLEAWVYPTVSESNDYPMIMAQAGGYPTGWYFSLRYTNEVNFYLNAADNAGGAIDLTTDGSDPVQINAWNHIAFSVSSGTGYIYVNGARKSSAATGINNNLDRSSTTFIIGTMDGASYDFDGYICDARIVKGTALYSGTTYTVPTAPLTAVTNTKLLLNMADGQAIDSTSQNNLTLYGTAKTSTAQKKFGTASLLLDGNSDYATFSENGGNNIDGGGNWTVEFFWRFVNKTSPAYQELITKGNGFQIYTGNGTLSLALSSNNSSYDIANAGGTTLDNDVWYHLALVKNGTSYKLYLNGTSDISVTSSSNLDTGGFPWFLGTLRTAETTYPSNGYMDEVRISKFARYTSNFTAPTKAFADKGQ